MLPSHWFLSPAKHKASCHLIPFMHNHFPGSNSKKISLPREQCMSLASLYWNALHPEMGSHASAHKLNWEFLALAVNQPTGQALCSLFSPGHSLALFSLLYKNTAVSLFKRHKAASLFKCSITWPKGVGDPRTPRTFGNECQWRTRNIKEDMMNTSLFLPPFWKGTFILRRQVTFCFSVGSAAQTCVTCALKGRTDCNSRGSLQGVTHSGTGSCWNTQEATLLKEESKEQSLAPTQVMNHLKTLSRYN